MSIDHNGRQLHAAGSDMCDDIEPTVAQIGARVFGQRPTIAEATQIRDLNQTGARMYRRR